MTSPRILGTYEDQSSTSIVPLAAGRWAAHVDVQEDGTISHCTIWTDGTVDDDRMRDALAVIREQFELITKSLTQSLYSKEPTDV